MVEPFVEKRGVAEDPGVREGLLQEERPADALRLRCGDRLRAGIRAPVIQPLHTGTDGSTGISTTSDCTDY